MRVVFVNRFCHPDHSATSQMLSDLAAHLAERGMDVAMVASRQRYDDPSTRLPPKDRWRGVAIHRLWTSRFGRRNLAGRAVDYLTFYISLPITLWPLLRRGDMVVAKTDPPLVSLVVAMVARMRGAVLVNWLQDVFPEVAVSLGQPRLPKSAAWLMKWLRNVSLRAAAGNVAIGTRMAEYFVSQGIAPARVFVIPNWAHEAAIHPMPVEQSGLRARLGLSDKYVVGYSGNLGRAHDVDTLLDAVHRLSAEPRIAFLIVGGGHGYDRLKRETRDYGCIQFLPYQPMDALADSLAAADLHVISLKPELEGQIVPSKFYGVAAAERPIAFIGDLDGELARLVKANDCGFSVGPRQGEALATGIIDLAKDPGRGRGQGRRARKLLEQSFSRDYAQQQWHDLLLDLAAKGRP